MAFAVAGLLFGIGQAMDVDPVALRWLLSNHGVGCVQARNGLPQGVRGAIGFTTV
jgi:hypothetical protein